MHLLIYFFLISLETLTMDLKGFQLGLKKVKIQRRVKKLLTGAQMSKGLKWVLGGLRWLRNVQ